MGSHRKVRKPMTLYSHTLEVTGLEIVPIEAALLDYAVKCRNEIANGNTSPYDNHLRVIERAIKELADSCVLAISTRDDIRDRYEPPGG